MSEKPFVPFYKPYGMTDEEYNYEVQAAEQRLAEWEMEQDMLKEQEAPQEKEYCEWKLRAGGEHLVFDTDCGKVTNSILALAGEGRPCICGKTVVINMTSKPIKIKEVK